MRVLKSLYFTGSASSKSQQTNGYKSHYYYIIVLYEQTRGDSDLSNNLVLGLEGTSIHL